MQSKRSVIKREAWAAGTMIVLDLGAIAQASTYTIGSLARMGPGMFPAILGVLLVLLGLVIARTAYSPLAAGLLTGKYLGGARPASAPRVVALSWSPGLDSRAAGHSSSRSPGRNPNSRSMSAGLAPTSARFCRTVRQGSSRCSWNR